MEDPNLKQALEALDLLGEIAHMGGEYNDEEYEKDKNAITRIFDDFGFELNPDSLTVFKMGILGSIGCTSHEMNMQNHKPVYLALSVDRLIKELEK